MGARWCARWACSATSFPSTVTAKGATSSRRAQKTADRPSGRSRGVGEGTIMRVILRFLPWILLAALGIGGGTPPKTPEKTLKGGVARLTSKTAQLMGPKRGYFKTARLQPQ